MSDFSTTGTPGGGGAAPSITTNNPGIQSNPAGAGDIGAPQVIDLTDDSMVRLPGAKDPVKYGEHYRKFQSEFTRRAQEAAQLRQERENYQRALQERDQRLRQLEESQRRAQQPQSQQNNLVDQIRTLSYLKGEDGARLAEHITQELAQRDQAAERANLAIALMYKQMQQMGQQLAQVRDRHTGADFDSKMTNYVQSLGLPAKAVNLAKHLYLAYEGNDLDQEFPEILRTQWDEIQGLVREADRARAEEARNQNRFIPGRGGQGSPSRPLSFAGKNAAQKADLLWDSIQSSDT